VPHPTINGSVIGGDAAVALADCAFAKAITPSCAEATVAAVPWRPFAISDGFPYGAMRCPLFLKVSPCNSLQATEDVNCWQLRLNTRVTRGDFRPYAEQPSMKTIKTYSTTVEADLARLALEAAGIPSTVVGISAGMEGGVAGVQLLVPDDRVEAALTLLKDA
jgi:Putative prokaryotic signal transducing protein